MSSIFRPKWKKSCRKSTTPKLKESMISNASYDNITMSNISKRKKTNDILSKFVIKTIPEISLDPDYASLNNMIQALYANSAIL